MNRFLRNTIALLAVFFTIQAQAIDIVELRQANANKVVFKVRFDNGSIADPADKRGLTFATASLMAQGGAGGTRYSAIRDMLMPWAATYSASVDKQVTTFTFQVPVDFVDEFYPLVRNVLLSPNFIERDFSRVMKAQQNYVDQLVRASSDENYSKFALEDQLFRGGNMQHLREGTSVDVKSISLDDIKAHYKNAFTRHNVSAGIAGNYDDATLGKLKADLAKLPDTAYTAIIPSKAKTAKGIEVEIISKEGAFGSAIFTGAPLAITRANDEFAALMIANSWMGEHRKAYSRLYQKIRQTRSMNYGDYSYIEWYSEGGSYQLPPSDVPRSSNYWSIWIRPVQIASQLKSQYPELADIEVGHAHFALRMRKDIGEHAATVLGKYIVFSKAEVDAKRTDWQVVGAWGEGVEAALEGVFGSVPEDKWGSVSGTGFTLVRTDAAQTDPGRSQFEIYLTAGHEKLNELKSIIISEAVTGKIKI